MKGGREKRKVDEGGREKRMWMQAFRDMLLKLWLVKVFGDIKSFTCISYLGVGRRRGVRGAWGRGRKLDVRT